VIHSAERFEFRNETAFGVKAGRFIHYFDGNQTAAGAKGDGARRKLEHAFVD
jgi:hypothetical protein